nr:MAG: hypothetical protein [Bacteriophage sp.]
MIPVNQFILGSSDPLLYPSEKMTNSIDEQIAFLQSQKQAINEAYRRNAIPNANNGTTQNQQVPTQGIWDAIDAEIAPLTQEQQNMLLSNQDYVNNYNALQSMVQAEVLNLVRGKIEASADGKHLLEEQLKLVKLLKSKIVEVTNKEMELFKAFKEASKTNPNLTMLMSSGYNDDGYHFNEYEAKEVVEQMYHVKDNKKYIGEKYDMNKAHEICERYKEVLPNDVEPCDVYVAINAQYHDYAKLFEEWFGGNIDNKVFESAITFWFKDVDFDGDKVWEYFHMNN